MQCASEMDYCLTGLLEVNVKIAELEPKQNPTVRVLANNKSDKDPDRGDDNVRNKRPLVNKCRFMAGKHKGEVRDHAIHNRFLYVENPAVVTPEGYYVRAASTSSFTETESMKFII